MDSTCSSETSADFQWVARRYIPQDRILQDIICSRAEINVIGVSWNDKFSSLFFLKLSASHRTGSFRGKALCLHLGGARLESRPGHLLT
jgi:hypothetical protein